MTEVYADLLVEHARGDSLRVIARRHGIGHETVRRRVLEEGSKLIADLERELLLAELMRDAGREGTGLPASSRHRNRATEWPPSTCSRGLSSAYESGAGTSKSSLARRPPGGCVHVVHNLGGGEMTVITQRDRLKSIKERKESARAARGHARQVLEAAQAAGDTQAEGIAALALQRADTELETAQELHNMLLSAIDGNGNGHGRSGESFLDDPSTVTTLEQLAHSSAPIGSVMLGSFMSAEAFASSLRPRAQASDDQPGLEGKRKQVWAPIVRQPYRPLTLLDLIPTGTMGGSAIEYVVELGDLDSGVAERPRVRSSRRAMSSSRRPRRRPERSRRGSSSAARCWPTSPNSRRCSRRG